jgi:hypothetical protein
MSYSDFSSWPRDQEQSFVVYEQHASESTKKAISMGIVAGIAFFVLMVGIYAGVAPDKKDLSQGMNMQNLTKKSKVAAPAPAPDPAPAPKAEAPAPAPAAAPAGDKAAAPADDKK